MINWMLDKYRVVEINREVRRLKRRAAKFDASFWTSVAVSNHHRDLGDEAKKYQFREVAYGFLTTRRQLLNKVHVLEAIRDCIELYNQQEK